MTPAEAIADVERTVALWLRQGLPAPVAWEAITGRRSLVKWPAVKALMIRIALGHRGRKTDPMFAPDFGQRRRRLVA